MTVIYLSLILCFSGLINFNQTGLFSYFLSLFSDPRSRSNPNLNNVSREPNESGKSTPDPNKPKKVIYEVIVWPACIWLDLLETPHLHYFLCPVALWSSSKWYTGLGQFHFGLSEATALWLW